MSVFRPTDLGEECQCKRCVTIGYGEDSWQPCTNDFWPTTNGKLSFSRCRACVDEVKQGRRGFME